MTARQKRRREMLNQRYPIAGKQLERSFTDVIDSLLHRWIRGPEHDQRILHSDEKREYQWSLELSSPVESMEGARDGAPSADELTGGAQL
jgi:hypothetical protein